MREFRDLDLFIAYRKKLLSEGLDFVVAGYFKEGSQRTARTLVDATLEFCLDKIAPRMFKFLV